MNKWNVGVVGCTGMVGQRFLTLLKNHPWFTVTALAASSHSAGKPYQEAVRGRWKMSVPIPESFKEMVVYDAVSDRVRIAEQVDFIFCAVDMKKDDIRALEESYARAECPVVSNNSANRWTSDVPKVIPEENPSHLEIIPIQRQRLGTKKGFIAVKSNCSIQSYVPALAPLLDFEPERVLVCTYQAISGAGRTFDTWPEMTDNLIPYIGGEEEKSEQEPLKIWGSLTPEGIQAANFPSITAQCFRVPVSDGHMAAVFASFRHTPDISVVKNRWAAFQGLPQKLALPSAPLHPLYYFEEPDRPQTRLDRDLENGMAISIGRLRPDSQYDYKFACLSHNTLRGAAGGGVLLAELLCAQGYMD